ncbi:hypothetical protein J6590_025760 [Homalodisca vitripennis]|nr:hypothetical protein J6590_025760 [Homalodisca vitripennis]
MTEGEIIADLLTNSDEGGEEGGGDTSTLTATNTLNKDTVLCAFAIAVTWAEENGVSVSDILTYPKRYPFPTDNMENNQVLNVNKDAINPGIEDESEQREEAEQTPIIPHANQVNILTAVNNESRMNENSATNTYAANFPDSLQRREDGATAPPTLNVVEHSHCTQSVDAIGSDRSNKQTADESQSTALHAIMNGLKQLNENLINTKSELNENLNAKINKISDCISKTKIELSYEIKSCRETLETQINELRDNQTEFRNELNAIRDNQDQFREKIDLKIKESTDSIRGELNHSFEEHKAFVNQQMNNQQFKILESVQNKNQTLENKIAFEIKML